MDAAVLRQRRRSIEHAAPRYSQHPLRQGSTSRIAEVYGVTQGRIRHERTGPQGSRLRPAMELVLHGDEEQARAVVVAILAAWEHRAILAQETPVLEARYRQLWHREPALDAEEDRQAALFMGGASGDAYGSALLLHGGVQIELEAHRLELEARDVDVRALLVRGAA